MSLARLCLNKAGLLTGRARALPRPMPAAAALFSSSAEADNADANCGEVAVAERWGGGRWGWRDLRDFVPFRLVDGLGHALSHVTENLSRPLERLAPARLLGRMKEDEQRYRLRFEMPGLGKDDVKITVEDGVLVIQGEKKEQEEEEEEDDDGWWSASSYGYYHTSLLLPDDAKVDGITAEAKDGVLYVTIPRTAEKKRNVTEVKVQ